MMAALRQEEWEQGELKIDSSDVKLVYTFNSQRKQRVNKQQTLGSKGCMRAER